MPARLRAALQDLAEHPARLFALLVLANAVWLPYAGLIHDSRLYAAQAQNAWDGRFADDLFFRYGSQARYTLFPQLFAPACGLFGPELPFWVGYLASVLAFLAAAHRFVLALLGRTPAAVVAVVLVACTPIPLGGTGLFQVNEPFLTPRTAAVALSLFAFERLLVGRMWQAGLLLVPAAALHPLAAAPACLVWGLWVVRTATGWSPAVVALLAVGLGVAAAAVLFVNPDLGRRVFGHFDPEWRTWVFRMHKYSDPANWPAKDWFRLVQGLGFAAGMVVVWAGDRRRRALVVFAALLAVAGAVVAWIAARSEYALLFQGQAYRWVWPLEFLRFPLGFALIVRLWAAGTPEARVATVVVAGLLGGLPLADPRAVVPAVLVGAVGVVLWRGLGRAPLRPDWAVPATFAAVATGVVLGDVLRISDPVRALAGGYRWDRTFDLAERVAVWSLLPGPATRLLVVFAIGSTLLRTRRVVPLALASALTVHVLAFAVPRSEWAVRTFVPERADAAFIRDYLDRHHDSKRPTVYWPTGRIEAAWFWLECPCYFDSYQTSGNAFQRATAAEADRRALLVRAFEIDRFRRDGVAVWEQELRAGTDNIFVATWDHPPPRADDLAKLAADPAVDVIVLGLEFPGAAASNGRVFIYEARNLRAR